MGFDKKMPTMGIKIEEQDENGQIIKDQEKESDVNNNEVEENENVEQIDENIQNLQQQIEELKSKNSELERKLMYVAAEYENSKKRNVIDLENANKFAINKFAIDAVGIFDVLQTAISNVDVNNTDKTLFDGVKMTIGEFEKMFERIKIVKINPEIGSKFDHNKHEAISRVPNELEAGSIVTVVRPGYELYGRLLRPAMVVVSGGK